MARPLCRTGFNLSLVCLKQQLVSEGVLIRGARGTKIGGRAGSTAFSDARAKNGQSRAKSIVRRAVWSGSVFCVRRFISRVHNWFTVAKGTKRNKKPTQLADPAPLQNAPVCP